MHICPFQQIFAPSSGYKKLKYWHQYYTLLHYKEVLIVILKFYTDSRLFKIEFIKKEGSHFRSVNNKSKFVFICMGIYGNRVRLLWTLQPLMVCTILIHKDVNPCLDMKCVIAPPTCPVLAV